MSNVPVRYVPKHLSKRDEQLQKKQLIKSRRLYKSKKYHTRKKVSSFKNKKSSHVLRAKQLYKVDEIAPTANLSKKTKCKITGLREIFKKGQGAYYSSGSRPNQTAHSWGYARLASALTGGPASMVDFHILKDKCSKNSKAFKMAKQTIKKSKSSKTKKNVKKVSLNK